MTPELKQLRETRRAREKRIPPDRLPVVVASTMKKYQRKKKMEATD
jgi:hypothetical protein